MNKTNIDLIAMLKNHYNKFETEDDFKIKVVGNYEFHESYPYEKYLLYDPPIFENFDDKVALDFGCGMGRMVKRMNKIFKRTDGVDIGKNLINYCKTNITNSNFWLSHGDDCGDAFVNHYDFAYSTICLQHIPSFDVRMRIFNNICTCLKEGGRYSFNMYSCNDEKAAEKHYIDIHGESYARWRENHFDATQTNSGHDVIILVEDYSTVISDMKTIFSTCDIKEDKRTTGFTKIYLYGCK